ncbi:hypothetical protein BTR14_13100 [Rhizobium rhizosphaerae]|uniref:HTH merR-type domain-containing protein n=1 Tax=Xaviernesmea rhizosphaerae TaxID=1672749 RepID=A0ABX3PD30_9HYPH|nr:hypothetical protein [Xaviernesmea rhizosphaerae]OQP86014.1 hypothetical protein BTR14_13100 [Xaviernesmea rhizosphaerae]
MDEVKQPSAPPVTIDEMVPHDVLLEQHPWLTPQMLSKWRRKGLLRSIRGRDGKLVYPRSDLDRAVTAALVQESEDEEPEQPVIHWRQPGPASNSSERNIALDELGERLFLKSLAKRSKPGKANASPDSTEIDQIRERLFLESLQPKNRSRRPKPT